MDDKIDITITAEGAVAVVTFKAASIVDEEGIAIAGGQIKRFVDENQPGGLVFDFGEVKFFSSRVLGLLLEIRSKLDAYKGRVVISGINPQLHRIFRITNLDKIFEFFPDNCSAVKMMSLK